MKKQLLKLLSIATLLATVHAKAQFTFHDVQYWLGAGADSSLLVVDFHDASWDTSYAWGYLHDGSATAEDMLNAIAEADVNFSVNMEGGFLNDIIYGAHLGVGGTDGFYWSTWSGTSTETFAMNGGISAGLANGDWFGCSFTDWDPALAPGEPLPAFDPYSFTAQDVEFWVGTGSDTTVLVVDFLDGTGSSSFAWGYLHEGEVTAEQMLIDIAAADEDFSVNIGSGFLNDITYGVHTGIGGSPDYWGTWSGTNLGDWYMNMGIGTLLGNGDLFGCSYMSFSPVVRPGYPVAAPDNTVGVEEVDMSQLVLYPNPATDVLNIALKDSGMQVASVSVFDVAGKVVYQQNNVVGTTQISVADLPNGLYVLVIANNDGGFSQRFVKQ